MEKFCVGDLVVLSDEGIKGLMNNKFNPGWNKALTELISTPATVLQIIGESSENPHIRVNISNGIVNSAIILPKYLQPYIGNTDQIQSFIDNM